jgi:gamma-glutamyltranspeptidase/glutathione hydrolase
MHASRIADDAAAAAVFLPGGRAPRAGERFANPSLARLLELIAREGEDGFYRGQVAELIGDAVAGVGGPLRADDLAAWAGPQFVAPVANDYRGVRVYETPPPGQGIVALTALGIYEGTISADRIEQEHLAIESLKLAFADAAALLADPLVVDVPVARLLSDAYLEARRALIGRHAADIAAPGPATDTVYVAAVDGEGGACSLIQSLYSGFGSGIGVAGLGITLQNRGKGFVLDDGHPNQLAPGKRPYHTIIPGMLARDGAFHGCVGCVGGFMQPQGQMQVIRHLIDHDMDVGAAVAAPRLRFLDGLEIGAEPTFNAHVLDGLSARGHRVKPLSNFGAGGVQLIVREGDRLLGASDPRKDGCTLST